MIGAQTYSDWETFWYVGGFLAWTPAYVAVVMIAFKDRRLEIPMLAATSNVVWEFMWGFVFTQDMGPGLQFVYRGACILDLFILFNVFRYGAKQTSAPLLQRHHVTLVLAMIGGWAWFFWALRDTQYDLPLGSVSAYLDNLLMSGLYLWLLLTRPDPRELSLTVALSKGIGTGMVTVFVFMRYPGHSFVQALAVMVSVLDTAYTVGLALRLRHSRRQERSSAAMPAIV
jgi:hypothetical protein